MTYYQNDKVLDKELTTPNFRRSIKDYVLETDMMDDKGGYRPAKLFERNVVNFYKNY